MPADAAPESRDLTGDDADNPGEKACTYHGGAPAGFYSKVRAVHFLGGMAQEADDHNPG